MSKLAKCTVRLSCIISCIQWSIRDANTHPKICTSHIEDQCSILVGDIATDRGFHQSKTDDGNMVTCGHASRSATLFFPSSFGIALVLDIPFKPRPFLSFLSFVFAWVGGLLYTRNLEKSTRLDFQLSPSGVETFLRFSCIASFIASFACSMRLILSFADSYPPLIF